jgi:hypothetical protein
VKVVEVWWTDTTNVAGGWHDADELQDFAINQKWECHNIGWLVYEDKDCVVLAGRQTTDGKHTGMVERIPKKMITKQLGISLEEK